MEQSKQGPRHMGKSERQRLWESLQRASRDELDAPLFVLSEGDIAKLFKLINDGEVTRDISSQLAVLGNLEKAAFYPVKGLKGIKNSLLLAVESYKALLICHAILLVLTVVALVAMARA